MGYRSLKAFPPAVQDAIERVVEENAPLVLTFPPEAKGTAINRAITLRSFLKILRSTPRSQVPKDLEYLHTTSAVVYVSGPVETPTGWKVTVHPHEPLTGYSLEEQLGGYIPRRFRVAPAPDSDSRAVAVPHYHEVPSNEPDPEIELSDARLMALFQLSSPVLRMLPPKQRARIEEMVYGMLPQPSAEDIAREVEELKQQDTLLRSMPGAG